MNIRQKWASSIMPKNDALNVKMWALDNEKSIFFWQDKDLNVDLPFNLGIQTPWQL
jgi:hypothetical protein